jgi:hypothetical protein
MKEIKQGLMHSLQSFLKFPKQTKAKRGFMKWLRYQRVISLETQVGITSQRNKWANTDPRIYRMGDQVPRSNAKTIIQNGCV